MRSALFVTAILLTAPAAVGAATPTPAPKATATPLSSRASRLAEMAPADAYFGAFGMSPLSIRSTIGFLGRQYHYRTISDHDLLRKALVTEDALRKWRSKYPNDPWLPPTFYHLEQLYQAVQTEEARKHARAILTDVVHNYPSGKEGHLSRARLAAGFPALVPETPLVATPEPTTAAPVSPETSPSPAEPNVSSPEPGSSPGSSVPGPSPSNAPSSGPPPSPAPGASPS